MKDWSEYTEDTEPLGDLGHDAVNMLTQADIGFDRNDTALQLQRIGQQVTELGMALDLEDQEGEYQQIADIVISTCVLAAMSGVVLDLCVEVRWTQVREQYS